MLDDETIATLKTALTALQKPVSSTGAWHAIGPLAALLDTNIAFTIDLHASDEVGAPVIVATPASNLDALLAPLTKRQRQVARLLIEGHPNKQIARSLDISLGTTKDHVHAILGRLKMTSRSALIAAATR